MSYTTVGCPPTQYTMVLQTGYFLAYHSLILYIAPDFKEYLLPIFNCMSVRSNKKYFLIFQRYTPRKCFFNLQHEILSFPENRRTKAN